MVKLKKRETRDEGRGTSNERRRTTMIFRFLVIVCIFLSSFVSHPSSLVYAAVPHLISYQGRLTDKEGKPLDGAYELTFSIYDAETGGNLLWQGKYSVAIQKGIFNVLLGERNESPYNFADLTFDKQYFLQVQVGDDEPMTPMQRITPIGYAIRAENAEKAQTAQNSERLNNQSASYYLTHSNLSGLSANDHPQYVRGQGNSYKIDSGLVTIDSNEVRTISFSVRFSSPPKVVVSLGGRGNSDRTYCWAQDVTTTSFGIGYFGGSGGSMPLYWTAIGQAE